VLGYEYLLEGRAFVDGCDTLVKVHPLFALDHHLDSLPEQEVQGGEVHLSKVVSAGYFSLLVLVAFTHHF